MKLIRFGLLFLLVIVFGASSSDGVSAETEPENNQLFRNFDTPTYELGVRALPLFDDDLDFDGLNTAIQRQLYVYKVDPRRGKIKFGDDSYDLGHIQKTLESFLELSKATKKCIRDKNSRSVCMRTFRAAIKRDYRVYAPKLIASDPRQGQAESAFFTAYYTPTLTVSEVQTEEFPHAIYSNPSVAHLRESTRVAIDFDHVLAGSGNELFYARDLFDLYLLNVQGSGKVIIGEGKNRREQYIYYSGKNGHPFPFIYHYMMAKGYIKSGNIDEQRKFMADHPELNREIYAQCPGYVYFSVGSNPPMGSAGAPVTPGRSIATDSSLYGYKGTLAFVQAKRPTEESAAGKGPIVFKNFSRFMLDQDTGSAIKGKARADLYHGESRYAERAAYSTQHTGRIFFIMLKQ